MQKVRGSLFTGAFLPKVPGSRGTKLGNNSGRIIFSLKRVQQLVVIQVCNILLKKGAQNLVIIKGGLIFSPKSPGLIQRVISSEITT